MKEIWNWIQVAFSALGGVIAWFLGGLDGLIYALIAFVVADYISGFLRAAYEKKLSSRIGAQGIAKKVAVFLLVGIAHLADTHLLGNTGALRSAVICFYITNEGLSLIENVCALGIPIPDPLRNVLAQLHGKTDPAPAEQGGGYITPPHPDPVTPTENETELEEPEHENLS
jgi:toxin secretion/phage lysis holin